MAMEPVSKISRMIIMFVDRIIIVIDLTTRSQQIVANNADTNYR